MIRLLLLLILVAVAYSAWRLVRNVLESRGPQPPRPGEFEPMARCAKCGTHVPRTQLDAQNLCAQCRA